MTPDFTVHTVAPHPLPQYVGVLTAGFPATGLIQRAAFGMTGFVPNIGDEATLLREIEGQAR